MKSYYKYLILGVFISVVFILSPTVLKAQSGINIDLQTSLSGHYQGEGVSITRGDRITIMYEATGGGVTRCNNSATGMAGAKGDFPVSPFFTTIYTIECFSPNASASKNIKITVIIPPDKLIANVITRQATNITEDSAKLWGSLIPGDDSTNKAKVYFRYSAVSPERITPVFCNNIYGSDMKSTDEFRDWSAWGNEPMAFFSTITNLTPDTTYYYCIFGSNRNQIAYAENVESFTTLPLHDVSIRTDEALVASGDLAYLKGFYNTILPAYTWFEYRKQKSEREATPAGTNTGSGVSILDSFLMMFKTNEAIALTSTGEDPYIWKKVGEKKRNRGTSGNLYFPLSELKSGTNYEFRAGISVSYNGITDTTYGETKKFTTKGSAGETTTEGAPPEGTGYVVGCTNTNDINCNGTSSEPTEPPSPNDLNNSPDLIASAISPTTGILGTSIKLTATIKNQGNGSTIKPPTPIRNNNVLPVNNGAGVSFFKGILEAKKAIAVTFSPEEISAINTGTLSAANSFYGFFQIASNNPGSSTNSNGSENRLLGPPIIITPTTPPSSGRLNMLNDLLKTSKAFAAIAPTGFAVQNNTIIDLPPVSISSLSGKATTKITSNYTFTKTGTYYARACADKKNRSDFGKIAESNENNNCGPWTQIFISTTGTLDSTKNICTDRSAKNYNLTLPCLYNLEDSTIGTDGDSGNDLPTIGTDSTYVDNGITGNGNTGNSGINSNSNSGSGSNAGSGTGIGTSIGQIANPPVDAIVRYREGVEHVFVRQIIANTSIQQMYGYKDSNDLNAFAWYLADILARTFGYVGTSGKEIRVSKPDIAAYELRVQGGGITVYEYYDSKIVNIQSTTGVLRNAYYYEYYFNKR